MSLSERVTKLEMFPLIHIKIIGTSVCNSQENIAKLSFICPNPDGSFNAVAEAILSQTLVRKPLMPGTNAIKKFTPSLGIPYLGVQTPK